MTSITPAPRRRAASVAGMGTGKDVACMLQPVLGSPYPRALAEYYRRLLGFTYRAGDQPREGGSPPPG